MSAPIKTLAELSFEAQDALYERLGVADTVRYLNQFRHGSGNYTKEREERYTDESVEDVVSRIEAQRAKKQFG